MSEERKIYTSFHDIPPRDYMYFPKGSLDAGKPGKFSKIEIQHILISILVLSVVFTLLITRNNILSGLNSGFNLNIIPYWFVVALLGVITAFFFHEISHKIMAQKLGLWAEYRMYPQGLGFALLLGIFIPFIFAAPGAVMFRGGARFHETGRIAMAGPLANIVVAAITLPLYLFIFFENSLIGPILGFICYINAFLGFFNLLPFGPLDGIKIIRWNATVWIFMLIASIGLMISIFLRFNLNIIS